MKPNIPFLKMGLITLLVAAGVTLLCSLGFWQLSRAQEKEALLQQQQQGKKQPLLTQAALTQASRHLRYHRISLQGHFLNEHIILLDNITKRSLPGYYVFAPFSLKNGEVVLVNRGWIPLGPSRNQLPKPMPVKGEVTIEGYIDFAYRNPFIKHALEN